MNSKFTQKIESIFEEHLLPIVEESKLVDEGQVQTSIYNMQKAMTQKVEELGEQSKEYTLEFINELFSSMKDMNIDEFIERIEQSNEKEIAILTTEEPRFELLLKLLEESASISPFFPIIMLNRLHFVDFMKKYLISYHSMKKLSLVENGEARANQLMQTFGLVTESLYKHYIKMLWELWCIRNGRKDISTHKNLGVVLNQLDDHLSGQHKSIIHPYAAKIRNAAQHHDWKYNPDNDSIYIFENSTCTGYTPVDDLINMVEDMFHFSGTYVYHLIQIYNKNLLMDRDSLAAQKKLAKNITINGFEKVDPIIFLEIENRNKELAAPIHEYNFNRA